MVHTQLSKIQSWLTEEYTQIKVVFPSFHRSNLLGAKKLIMVALMLTTGLTNERREIESKGSDLIKEVGFMISLTTAPGY